MARVWHWPWCTYKGCDHTRSWRTEAQVIAAAERHPSWVQGDQAICYCHGLEKGATFPCDETQKLTAHA